MFTDGCTMAVLNDKIVAYGLAHPWIDEPVPLNKQITELPKNPTHFYIHDIAVHPDHRNVGVGIGLASLIIVAGMKHGFSNFSLVSVQQSERFWKKLGFKTLRTLDYSGTGDSSDCYMIRKF